MLSQCQLFGTLGCHLCEIAEANHAAREHGLLVGGGISPIPRTLTDVYGLHIPVLRRMDTRRNWTGRSTFQSRWLPSLR